MKIRCDVCSKGEASVFCIADEAALCDACDHRVHHANKLAGKHQRFSLLYPPPKQVPLCDICQERRAFLFCQQDRAILCRECDIPIHKANEHTQKHNRFLLTGVKLSANSALYSSSPAANSVSKVSDSVSNLNSQNPILNKPVSANPTLPKINNPNSCCMNPKATTAIAGTKENGNSNTPTSSISEYLIEMLPGWHVEDLLDPSPPFGFCKSNGGDSDVIPFWDADDLHSNLSSFSPESPGLWVPQAEPSSLYPSQIQSFSTNSNMGFGGQICFKDPNGISNIKFSRKWSDDNSFAVPQINPPSSASNKRFRTSW